MNSEDSLSNKAKFHFSQARNRAFLKDISRRLFQQSNELYSFDEVKNILSPHGMSYRGLKTIPIDKIAGSEGRYHDFNKDFMPRTENSRSRWENIDIANMKEVTLPPINVYKIGKFYFVRDGNHRVSVARQLGQEFIDAEVVELFVKVKPDEISDKALLLAESYRYFLVETKFDEIVKNVEIKLTNPWSYYRLIEHIEAFKGLLENSEHREVTWEEGVTRWYSELFLKTVSIINRRKILRNFPGREPGDLYIWVMDYWHFFKEKDGNITLEKAIEDYSDRFGNNIINKIFEKIKKIFQNKTK